MMDISIYVLKILKVKWSYGRDLMDIRYNSLFILYSRNRYGIIANTSDSFVYTARYDGSNERQNERRFFETGR